MPGSGAGIFKKMLGKDKKPLNTQRVVISDTQKNGFLETAGSPQNKTASSPLDLTDLYEESFLEDTPAEGAIFEKRDPKGKHRAGKPEPVKKRDKKDIGKPVIERIDPKAEGSKVNNAAAPKAEGFRVNSMVFPKVEGTRVNSAASPKAEGTRVNNAVTPKAESFKGVTEKRYNSNKKSIFSIFSEIPELFKKKSKTSNSSALEFAANGKRLGRKGRRNRRIFIYAGTGLVAAVITLFIVFVPGQAAPADTQSPGVSQQSSPVSYLAVNTAAVSGTEAVSGTPSESSGLPSITPSASPTLSGTPIPTTSKDKSAPRIDLDEEVKKFMVKAKKYYTSMGYSSNHYKYTASEKYILAQVITREARGECFEGQIAVGNVIMNRVLNKRQFGSTIKSVVAASGQFAYSPSTIPVYSARRAAEQVLDYENWVIPQNTYYFRVSTSKAYWHGTYLKNIQHHAFYTNKYNGRSTVKSVPPALFERVYKWPTMGCKPEERVYRLQYMLNKLGYSKVKPDKYFGQDTKNAIMDFQSKHKLKADGIAGEGTLKKIIKAFGEDKYYEKFCK